MDGWAHCFYRGTGSSRERRTRLYAAAVSSSQARLRRRPEVAQLASTPDRLQPAEDLLHQLAPSEALSVARVPRRAPVDGAATATLVAGHVRRHPAGAHRRHEVTRVVGPVGPQRGATTHAPLQHLQGRLALAIAVRLTQLHVHHQPVPVLAEDVPQVAKLRLLLRSLAIESRLRVRARDVRLAHCDADPGSPPPRCARRPTRAAPARPADGSS